MSDGVVPSRFYQGGQHFENELVKRCLLASARMCPTASEAYFVVLITRSRLWLLQREPYNPGRIMLNFTNLALEETYRFLVLPPATTHTNQLPTVRIVKSSGGSGGIDNDQFVDCSVFEATLIAPHIAGGASAADSSAATTTTPSMEITSASLSSANDWASRVFDYIVSLNSIKSLRSQSSSGGSGGSIGVSSIAGGWSLYTPLVYYPVPSAAGGRGAGGRPFAVVHMNAPLVQLHVRSGRFVDGIELLFGDGTVLAAGGSGGSRSSVVLSENEEIVRVAGSYGNFIDSLELTTNRGRRFQFGGSGGKQRFEYTINVALEERFVGFWGNCGNLIDRIAPVSTCLASD